MTLLELCVNEESFKRVWNFLQWSFPMIIIPDLSSWTYGISLALPFRSQMAKWLRINVHSRLSWYHPNTHQLQSTCYFLAQLIYFSRYVSGLGKATMVTPTLQMKNDLGQGLWPSLSWNTSAACSHSRCFLPCLPSASQICKYALIPPDTEGRTACLGLLDGQLGEQRRTWKASGNSQSKWETS